MADMTAWPPERLRALDRAVAEARGWRPDVGYCTPDGKASWLAPVSLGCRETFDMQAEEKIEVCFHPSYDDWWAQRRMDEDGHCGPTPPIAICLAYLASKGRVFNG